MPEPLGIGYGEGPLLFERDAQATSKEVHSKWKEDRRSRLDSLVQSLPDHYFEESVTYDDHGKPKPRVKPSRKSIFLGRLKSRWQEFRPNLAILAVVLKHPLTSFVHPDRELLEVFKDAWRTEKNLQEEARKSTIRIEEDLQASYHEIHFCHGEITRLKAELEVVEEAWRHARAEHAALVANLIQEPQDPSQT